MEAGQEAATRYIQQNSAPLFADNETSLSEKYGRDVAAAIIATHLAKVASMVKTWHTREDDLVCDRCADLDGVDIPASDSFGPDTEFDDQPSCHPNRRCYIEYLLKAL